MSVFNFPATPVIPTEVPLKTPPHTTAFSDTTGEDLFLSSIQMSDSDRQHDAWLPGDHSNFTPVAENLSTPGLVVNEPQVNLSSHVCSQRA